jgi:hypothetical protein
MKKVVPSERLRRELDDVLNDITEEEDRSRRSRGLVRG